MRNEVHIVLRNCCSAFIKILKRHHGFISGKGCCHVELGGGGEESVVKVMDEHVHAEDLLPLR